MDMGGMDHGSLIVKALLREDTFAGLDRRLLYRLYKNTVAKLIIIRYYGTRLYYNLMYHFVFFSLTSFLIPEISTKKPRIAI